MNNESAPVAREPSAKIGRPLLVVALLVLAIPVANAVFVQVGTRLDATDQSKHEAQRLALAVESTRALGRVQLAFARARAADVDAETFLAELGAVRDAVSDSDHGGDRTRAITAATTEWQSAFRAAVQSAAATLHDEADTAGASAQAEVAFDQASVALGGLIQALEDAGRDERSSGVVTAHAWLWVLGLAVAGVIVWTQQRKHRARVWRTLESAAAVAQGNLIAVRPIDQPQHELDEIDSVLHSISHALHGQVEDTRKAMKVLSTSTGQILAAVDEQAAATKEQATSVQEITTTMQELGQSGIQIVERATTVSSTAQSSAQQSQTGLDAVEDASRGMEAIREQVEEVAENIVLLSEKTQAVGEIITAVNEIAEQSNLLALNAAIEATSAGEHGSRFAVVATEMKSLADHAKDSTSQVRTILGEIHKGINSAVMLTEEAVKRVESGKQRAQIMEETIRDLADSTQTSVDTFEQIIAGTNQQQIAFEQITRAMQDISDSSQQSSSTNTKLESAVASLAAMGHQISATVDRYQVK